jgi:hypothetical protein
MGGEGEQRQQQGNGKGKSKACLVLTCRHGLAGVHVRFFLPSDSAGSRACQKMLQFLG